MLPRTAAPAVQLKASTRVAQTLVIGARTCFGSFRRFASHGSSAYLIAAYGDSPADVEAHAMFCLVSCLFAVLAFLGVPVGRG